MLLTNGCDSLVVEQVQLQTLDFNLARQDIRCYGEENGLLFVDSLDGEGPFLYALNDGPFQTESYFANLSAGTYTLKVQNHLGCEGEQTTELEAPVELVVSVGEDQTIPYGDSAQLVVLSSRAIDSLRWNRPDLLSCPDCLDPMAFPEYTTLFNLEVIDANGCKASDQVRIHVMKDRPVYIPNAFSPDGDGINDWFSIYTGKSVARVNLLRIYSRWGRSGV